MLFDVAALLITSAALGPAAEASGVPEHGAVVSVARVVDLPVDITAGKQVLVVGPANSGSVISLASFQLGPASSAQLDRLSGVALLDRLAVLPSAQVSEYLTTHPHVVSTMLSAPPSAADVNGWWGTVASSEQTSLESSAPLLVGNLDGIPVSARNAANLSSMGSQLSTLDAQQSSIDGRALAQDAQNRLHMLQQVASVLKPTSSSAPRSLLELDSSGQGKAAVVIGNLQTADYVTYLVPGMFFTVDGQVHDWTGDAQDLYNQQVAWLKRVAAGDPSQQGKTVAVVAWMGYQTPDLTNIGSLDLAYQGRDNLARAIEGLQQLRQGNAPYLTVVAHSYGSTAALMALTEYQFHVNALVLVGTPGSAAQSVHDLHVDNANVFVGAAPWDPVPASAWFGSDPSSPSYGAKSMGVGGAKDPITGASLGQSVGHNNYFQAGSESIRNMAVIGIGQPELALRGTASDADRTLALVR